MNNNMVLSVDPAVILRKFLIDKNVVEGVSSSTTVWPSTHSKMPDAPDKIITFYLGTWVRDGHMMDGDSVVRPTIQILVRNTTGDGIWTKMADITRTLGVVGVDRDNPDFVEVSNFRFRLHSALCLSQPSPLGAERVNNTSTGNVRMPKEQGKLERVLFSTTYLVTITEEEP